MNSFDPARLRSLLKTTLLGREFHYFESVGSTSSLLSQMASQGCGEGATVLAEHQSAGRGRWGRHWESSAGKDLLFSFLLRPGSGMLSQLPAVFGLACLQAFKVGSLKWPNDIWIKQKKVGGMLLEGDAGALVVGIGINVNSKPEDFPPQLSGLATSLATEAGLELDRESLLAQVLGRCEALYRQWQNGGFDDLRRQWNENALFIGEIVRCGAMEGKVLGMDSDGALLWETAKGVEKLVSGEVSGLRPVLD